jgi:hypothetical protein
MRPSRIALFSTKKEKLLNPTKLMAPAGIRTSKNAVTYVSADPEAAIHRRD